MDTIYYNISQILGITIIHSLWQGAVVYLGLRIILQLLPNISAANKHKIAFTAMLVLLTWFSYTLVAEVNSFNWLVTKSSPNILPVTAALPFTNSQWIAVPVNRYYFAIAAYLPYLTMFYIGGLVFNMLRMVFAWNNIYRIRQNTQNSGLQYVADWLRGLLNISRQVKVACSDWIDVPCITGFIKPVILLPCTISTYLSAEEIKSILLHELAHVKRNDYLLNLLQQIISTILFFNPFTKLISNIIGTERENSCDDEVVGITAAPLVYAQALLKLEEQKKYDWQLALAATGKKYYLLNRIERIMKNSKSPMQLRPALIAIALLACGLSSIAWFNPKIEQGKISVNNVINPLIKNFMIDTPKTTIAIHKPVKVANKPVAPKAGKLSVDKKMARLQSEVDKHAQAIQQYYSSADFTKMQKDVEQQAAKISDYYNTPQFKQLTADIEKKAADFEKMATGPEMEKLQKQIEDSGADIEKYYNSPEFTGQQKAIERESELLSKAKPGSAEYKKHMVTVQKLAADMRNYTNNPGMKQQIELAKKLSAQASAYTKSPEFVKKQQELKVYSDSLVKAYNSTNAKQLKEQIKEATKGLKEYQNRPEIKREQQLLRESQQKLQEYMQSDEYRKGTSSAIKPEINVKIANTIKTEIKAANKLSVNAVVKPAPVAAPASVVTPAAVSPAAPAIAPAPVTAPTRVPAPPAAS